MPPVSKTFFIALLLIVCQNNSFADNLGGGRISSHFPPLGLREEGSGTTVRPRVIITPYTDNADGTYTLNHDHIPGPLGVGEDVPSGVELYVAGDAGISGELTVGGSIILTEITEPQAPFTNDLKIYNESIKGFSFVKYLDDTGMKRELVRDSMILVKNVRGTTIAANRIVYATGSEDNIPTVNLAKADSMATMPAIGVTIESIANDSYGRVMQVGLLEDINTNTLEEGDILYVSAATGGVPTTTAPVTPSFTQEIGTVLVKSATTGAIQIVARGLTGDEYGTAQNNFTIGDGTAGRKTLTFNAVEDGSFAWDEQFYLEDDTGISGDLTIGGTATFSSDLSVNGTTTTHNLRLVIPTVPTTPTTTGTEGDIAFDDDYLYYKTSGNWKRVTLASWSVVDEYLLLEAGSDYVLLEDGTSKIILE